jgi:spore coat protein CotF
MFRSVTLYEMLSVTSSRSLRFTALLCIIQSNAVKHSDLLEVTDNISYRVMSWNIKICWKSLTTVVSDFQQIFMFHSVTLYEMLSVSSSRSLCLTALLCMKCCHWQHFIQSNAVKRNDLLEVTDNISYRVMLWNIKICWKSLTTVVSDFQQIAMFHSVTLYEML